MTQLKKQALLASHHLGDNGSVANIPRSAPRQDTSKILTVVENECRVRVTPIGHRYKLARRTDQTLNAGPSQPEVDQRLVPARKSPWYEDTDAALLGLLYETVGNPSGWQPFLYALTKQSFFNRAVLSFHDAALRCGEIAAQVNCDPAAIDSYARHYAAISPWLAYPFVHPVGVLLTTEDVIPYADLLKTEYYQGFCRPWGYDLALRLTVLQDGARSMEVIAVGQRDDLERDRHIVGRLRHLAPHLLRVAQLSRQLAELQTRTVTTEVALDRLATAMMVINRSGRIVHWNSAAERLFAAADGLSIRCGELVTAYQGEGQTLRQLIAEALRASHNIAASPGGVMRLTRPSGRSSYEVLVAPVSDSTLALGFSGPLATVFVRDPEMQAVALPDRVQRLYGLTAAEAKLMQALVAGDTLEVAADRFGVRKETVRSQLRSVFLKTGTSSQVELVRLGLRGMATFDGAASPA